MRRYQTAHALAEDIERHLNNEPVLAGRPGTLYRFQKLVRRNKGVFAAVAVVAAVLVLGALVSTWQAALAKCAERREARLRQEAQANELAMRRLAYASDMSLAQQALTQNNLGRAQALLDRHRPKPEESDLRGWEWRYLWRQCRSDELFTLDQGSDCPVSLTVSPDGNWLAVGGYRGDLSIWDLTTRRRVETLEAGPGAIRAVFSPQQFLLAFGSTSAVGLNSQQSSVGLWDGRIRRTIAELPLSGHCAGLAFSDDGRTLVTATPGNPGQITLWSVPDGKKRVTHLVPPFEEGLPGWPLAVSRDLSMAACLCGAHALSSGFSHRPASLDEGSLDWFLRHVRFSPMARLWPRVALTPKRLSIFGTQLPAMSFAPWMATVLAFMICSSGATTTASWSPPVQTRLFRCGTSLRADLLPRSAATGMKCGAWPCCRTTPH